ncbi:glycosyltransferase [Pseudoalteromonas sp. BSi20429]|uniref:glycosyltransferase n=1 Tax=Pseudoalteromonas sp. BSi20429 TaxID=1097676 RepID=UPI00023177DE|nr:glycosyltransferase [Pseudoalteromonas sp. BSi20429]GAA68730.1 hypothetical protein P20429_2857 [Pseudoalteromonas sp. BSi20429]
MNIEKEYAPVVLFAYARPEHTLRTVNALKENLLANETELYVFLDYPKKIEHKNDYDAVDAIISELTGFKKVSIIRRSENFGLAKNIMTGVTDVVNEFGKVIVLEDDLVTSKYFLSFMNESLERYKTNKEVWHISGWTYPVDFEIKEDTFAWRAMNCWGWATWEDRWQHFEKNPTELIETFSKQDIKKFNIDSTHNFWKQVEANESGRLNTWAIFWYATIFSNNGLCINPTKTYVQNIGNDGSGENCGAWDIFTSPLASKICDTWVDSFNENTLALKAIKGFFRKTYPNIFIRAFRKFVRLAKA